MIKFRSRRIEYHMTNYVQTPPPGRGREINPLHAAFSLGEYVRIEHGNAGVARYASALTPFLPMELMEQLCRALGVPLPPPPPPSPAPPPPEEKPKPAGMPPEMMMLMMQMMNGGDVDPSMLMKLLGTKKDG